MDYLPWASIIFSILSLILMLILWKRLEDSTVTTLELLDFNMKEELEKLNVTLEPIIHASSRAMGALSSLSNDAKQDNALNRRIGQDLLSQNEEVLEVIKIAFPRVSEYIDEHPEAITKLMPRLNALLSDPEARKRLNLGSLLDTKDAYTNKDLSRIWEE